MNVAILGFGSQGASALEYWHGLGYAVTVCDRNESLGLPEGVAAQLGAGYMKGLERFDVIVRSPSIHPRNIVAANGETVLEKVTTNTNEFMRVCPSRRIIGVTGTKGKGTTSTLITRMLEAAGHRVHLGGNIGTPPLEMLKADIQPNDYVVLELANFQLVDLKYSPPIAVCLMVEPEHQDWHGDMEDYIRAKQQLFRWQGADDVVIFYAANELSRAVTGVSSGIHIPYLAEPGALVASDKIVIDGIEICNVSEIKLRGRHSWQNICAAVTATWQVTQDTAAIRGVIQTVSELPFRIELRRVLNGISYYNDSFATGPGATIAAINAVPEPKVLIIGGHDRGLPLDRLASEVTRHAADIHKLLLIGASAGRLVEVLTASGFDNFEVSDAKDMPAIVAAARTQAQPGDAIILSPAFASFDMFKNFEERGKAFNAAVDTLS